MSPLRTPSAAAAPRGHLGRQTVSGRRAGGSGRRRRAAPGPRALRHPAVPFGTRQFRGCEKPALREAGRTSARSSRASATCSAGRRRGAGRRQGSGPRVPTRRRDGRADCAPGLAAIGGKRGLPPFRHPSPSQGVRSAWIQLINTLRAPHTPPCPAPHHGVRENNWVRRKDFYFLEFFF